MPSFISIAIIAINESADKFTFVTKHFLHFIHQTPLSATNLLSGTC